MEANVPKTTNTPEMVKQVTTNFGPAETTTLYGDAVPEHPERKTDEVYKTIYDVPQKRILGQNAD